MPLLLRPAVRRRFWRRMVSEPTRLFVLVMALVLCAVWVVVMQQSALRLKREVGQAVERVNRLEARMDSLGPSLPAAAGAAQP